VLRITEGDAESGWLLKLEGRLSGPWVPELESAWRSVSRAHPGGAICIDLRDVDLVDAAGRRLLALMHHAGARFVSKGCAMSELVREITNGAATPRR